MAITNFTVPTESEKKCNPNYETWKDLSGRGCFYMYLSDFCTKDGGYGDNWADTAPTFNDLIVDGFTAWSCPQCGCNGNCLTIFTRF